MKRVALSRRAMLRGAGGVALGLPLLEIMLDDPKVAHAATGVKRYLVCFSGMSMGADGYTTASEYVPSNVGSGYELTTALAPFADYNVENIISVVSGLFIPSANGGALPAGGRGDDFHINCISPLISGVRTDDHAVHGATSDQIVADAVEQTVKTKFRSLPYRVQAGWYAATAAPYGRDVLSYRMNQGNLEAVPPTVSPSQAFSSLFSNFVEPGGGEIDPEQDYRMRARKSVLDLVRGNAELLSARLGGEDKKRIERHLDEIRDLERRIQTIVEQPAGSECKTIPDPGTDPPVGSNQQEGGFQTNVGYSNEEARARVFSDLIHMAFTCDLTRSASLMYTMAQSHLNMYELTGAATDLHEIGHNGVNDGFHQNAVAHAWHMKHFAYLVDKMRNTPDGAGTLLDNTAVVFVHEGGFGRDTLANTDFSTHSTENMACVVAGAGFKRGHHIQTNGAHPAQVLITAMQQAGVDVDTLGEVSGALPEIVG